MTTAEMVQLIIAGAVGGMVRSLYFREDWKGYVINCLAGAAVARYLGPEGPAVMGLFLGNFVDATALQNRTELVGFLLGAGGVAVVGWFYDLVETRLRKARGSNDEQKP